MLPNARVYPNKHRPIKRGRYEFYLWFDDTLPDGSAYRNCRGVTLLGGAVCSYHGRRYRTPLMPLRRDCACVKLARSFVEGVKRNG